MEKDTKKNIISEYKQRFPKTKFIPGETSVPVSGKIFDEKEIRQTYATGKGAILNRGRAEIVEEGMPPECRDAGITNPRECARRMMHKYGAPPECKNLDVEKCIDLMMKRGPENVGGPGQGFPPECEEAGAYEPRECFDIMNEKYGLPPFCAGLTEDECFEEIEKKHAPEGGPGFPPECEEAGATEPRACFNLMNDLYGPPQFCEGMADDECFEETKGAS